MDAVPAKMCKGRCGLVRPLTDFVPDKRRIEGRGSYCRDCENERLRHEPGAARWATPKQTDNRGHRVDVAGYLAALMNGTLDEATKLLGPE